MKNNHYKVLKRFGVAVIALGFLSINYSYANAADGDGQAPKEGMSVQELNGLVQNFEINQDGLNISFAGLIPARCVDSNAAMVYQGAKGGKQIFVAHLSADCEANPKMKPGEALVPLSRVFSPQKLQDVSGALTLRHLQAGDPNSRNRVADEVLKDGSDVAISIQSTKDKAEQARQDKLKDLSARVGTLCKSGDFAGVGTEIQGAADLLGDVTADLLDKVNIAEQGQFKDQMAAAKSAADAKAIMARYKDAASANGWDDSALNDSYVDVRFSLIGQLTDDLKSDKETKLSSVDKAMTDWQNELRLMDRATYRKNLDKFAEAYGNIAVVLAGQKNYVAAAAEYEKAKDLTTSADVKKSLDGQITKAYVAAYKACLQKDPTKAPACDKNYAAKAKEAANEMRDDLAQNANTDDGAAELNDFNAQYAETFGQGPSYSFSGYGSSNPYSPGLLEQYKQSQMMNYMNNMSMGNGANRAPTSSVSLF